MHRAVAFFATFIAIGLISEPIFGTETIKAPEMPSVFLPRPPGKPVDISKMQKGGKFPPKASGWDRRVMKPIKELPLPMQIRGPSRKKLTDNRKAFARSNLTTANVSSKHISKGPVRLVSTLSAIKSRTTGKRDEVVTTSKRNVDESATTTTSSQPHGVTTLSNVSGKLTTMLTSFNWSNAATLSAFSKTLQKTATTFEPRSTEEMERKATNALKTTERVTGSEEPASKYSQKTKKKEVDSETRMSKTVSTVAVNNASTLSLMSSSITQAFEISTSPLSLSGKPSTAGTKLIRENITSSSKRTTLLKQTSPQLTTKVGFDREIELALSQTNITKEAELTPLETNTTIKSIAQTTPTEPSTKIKGKPKKPPWILLPHTKLTSRRTTAKTTTMLTTTTTTTKATVRTTTSAAMITTTTITTTVTTTRVSTTTGASTSTGPCTSVSTTISATASTTTMKIATIRRRTKHPVPRPTKKPKKPKIAKMPSLEPFEETKGGDPVKSGGKGALIAGIVIGMVVIVAVVFASLFIMFQIKRRQAKHQQQQQQGQPAATDGNSEYGTVNSILNDPTSNVMESEWAPDKIKASQFTYKGPLQIPFKQPLILKHELEDEKPASQHDSQHVQFDDALNEVHEMGSEVEVIVFGGRQKKATKTGKPSTRYKHVPARVDTKEKQAQIAIREP